MSIPRTEFCHLWRVQLWIFTPLSEQIAIALSSYTVSELLLLWKLELLLDFNLLFDTVALVGTERIAACQC